MTLKNSIILIVAFLISNIINAQSSCIFLDKDYTYFNDSTVGVEHDIMNFFEREDDSKNEVFLVESSGNLDDYKVHSHRWGIDDENRDTISVIIAQNFPYYNTIGHKFIVASKPTKHPHFAFLAARINKKIIFYLYSYDNILYCLPENEGEQWQLILKLYEIVTNGSN